MDMFNKKSDTSTSTSTSSSTQQPQAQASGQKQDYGDKAFDFASKKAGHDFDSRTDEKITDGARGLYEKVTGSKVNDKISN